MELSEEAKQSYLDFCGIKENDSIRIGINYDEIEDQLTITETGTICDYFIEGNFDEGIPDEWDYTTKDNKYTFTVNRQGEDTILECIKSTRISRDKGNQMEQLLQLLIPNMNLQ